MVEGEHGLKSAREKSFTASSKSRHLSKILASGRRFVERFLKRFLLIGQLVSNIADKPPFD